MPKRLLKHAGNRGLALAMLGALWVLMGVGVAVAPLHRPELLDERLPVWVRAPMWGLPGLLALVASMRKKLDADAWGWLMVPAAVRFVSFAFAWVASLAGWDRFAYADGWRGATTIAAFVVFIKACAAGLDRAPVKPEA
jgi:hypothetical protein